MYWIQLRSLYSSLARLKSSSGRIMTHSFLYYDITIQTSESLCQKNGEKIFYALPVISSSSAKLPTVEVVRNYYWLRYRRVHYYYNY